MKNARIFAFVMTLILLCTLLPGCAKEETPSKTLPEVKKTEEQKEDKKEPEEYLANRLRRADVEAFPVVTEDMPISERRQLAIDFLICSFPSIGSPIWRSRITI